MDADQERRETQARGFYNGEFPMHVGQQIATPEARQANAREYIAYQARSMRDDINAIRAALEKIAAK
jgi:hypothetical protein